MSFMDYLDVKKVKEFFIVYINLIGINKRSAEKANINILLVIF